MDGINTGTMIVTFRMVVFVRYAQNHDTKALQIKNSELFFSRKVPNNTLLDWEELEDDELEHDVRNTAR